MADSRTEPRSAMSAEPLPGTFIRAIPTPSHHDARPPTHTEGHSPNSDSSDPLNPNHMGLGRGFPTDDDHQTLSWMSMPLHSGYSGENMYQANNPSNRNGYPARSSSAMAESPETAQQNFGFSPSPTSFSHWASGDTPSFSHIPSHSNVGRLGGNAMSDSPPNPLGSAFSAGAYATTYYAGDHSSKEIIVPAILEGPDSSNSDAMSIGAMSTRSTSSESSDLPYMDGVDSRAPLPDLMASNLPNLTIEPRSGATVMPEAQQHFLPNGNQPPRLNFANISALNQSYTAPMQQERNGTRVQHTGEADMDWESASIPHSPSADPDYHHRLLMHQIHLQQIHAQMAREIAAEIQAAEAAAAHHSASIPRDSKPQIHSSGDNVSDLSRMRPQLALQPSNSDHITRNLPQFAPQFNETIDARRYEPLHAAAIVPTPSAPAPTPNSAVPPSFSFDGDLAARLALREARAVVSKRAKPPSKKQSPAVPLQQPRSPGQPNAARSSSLGSGQVATSSTLPLSSAANSVASSDRRNSASALPAPQSATSSSVASEPYSPSRFSVRGRHSSISAAETSVPFSSPSSLNSSPSSLRRFSGSAGPSSPSSPLTPTSPSASLERSASTSSVSTNPGSKKTYKYLTSSSPTPISLRTVVIQGVEYQVSHKQADRLARRLECKTRWGVQGAPMTPSRAAAAEKRMRASGKFLKEERQRHTGS